MIIGSTKEQDINETRVALTPSVTKRLIELHHKIIIEKDFAYRTGYSDEEYKDSGAEIKKAKEEIYKTAEVLLQIAPPNPKIIKKTAIQQLLIADFRHTDLKSIEKKIPILRLELVPRTSVAQSIDILSAQNTVRGYMGALYALYCSPIVAPQMMTAAASIKAASALVIGAGVTGLQAASVFKRNGCRVTILDINEQSKELAASVGADFIMADTDEKLNAILKDKSFIFSSAAVPDGKSPVIIKNNQFGHIKKDAIVVDTTQNNINIKIPNQYPFIFCRDLYFERKAPVTASELWANNMYNLLSLIITKENTFDFSLNYITPMLTSIGDF